MPGVKEVDPSVVVNSNSRVSPLATLEEKVCASRIAWYSVGAVVGLSQVTLKLVVVLAVLSSCTFEAISGSVERHKETHFCIKTLDV